ncbi:MAG TPA: MaoC family dehydratase N-terminal domain-containing protein [Burkholderiales bacterium]|nr:MaoC family dehydratase N-terminal domain-containing protein [Burkholderiales bacterium]
MRGNVTRMPINIAALKAWVGRQEAAGDVLAPFQANALAATLDRDETYPAGAPLPPLWNWVYLNELFKTSELADNGHGTLGGFMPPIPLPRRMWAGGRFTFKRPLRIGQAARRVSTVADLTAKEGDSGELVFLLLRHEISGPDGTAITEEQDIVYRAPPRTSEPPARVRRAADKALWRREIALNEVQLFRYSALIFNAHRIHYDEPYCRREGYPGLVVHGPLLATLLADLVRRNTDRPMTAFRYRAVRPLFLPSPCIACGVPKGNTVELWAEDEDGALIMEARAELSRP